MPCQPKFASSCAPPTTSAYSSTTPATGATATIDACEEGPIVAALEAAGWRLTHILVTHHHDDHIAAIPALKARYAPLVIGPAADAGRIPDMAQGVREGDKVRVGSLEADVIETPGHTVGHISFHFPADRLLFAGDTLFALGCGRLLGGTPAQMWSSLSKLALLPDATSVYCGHEYTLSNARFALGVDPDNAALRQRAAEVEALRAKGAFTLPTTIGAERRPTPSCGLPSRAWRSVWAWPDARPSTCSPNCANARTADEQAGR